MSRKSAGQRAYERELSVYPRYHDGGLRPHWDHLGEVGQQSWEKQPYDRDCVAEAIERRQQQMLSLLTRIYTECDDRDSGGDARFSAELYEELRRFVKEMQK